MEKVERYLVDMIRLSVRLEKEKVKNKMQNYLDRIDIEVEYWQDFKIKGYKHNFKFVAMSETTNKPESFWFGFEHNCEKLSMCTKVNIEYNPNKCSCELLRELLCEFFSGESVEIVSVDLACDLETNILNVFVAKDFKKVKMTYDLGQDNRTIYLGKGNGRIKIYNKGREMKLNRDLTRYEISLRVNLPLVIYDRFTFDDSHLVPVYILNYYQYTLMPDITATDRALLYAVLNGYPIELLSRDKIKKIKNYLTNSGQIPISAKGFLESFYKYFKSLLEFLQKNNSTYLVPCLNYFKFFEKFRDD